MTTARRVTLWIAPGLMVALGAGAIAWRSHFDGLYGQDPYTYYSYAMGPLRDSLAHGHGPPPFFWPPGYPLLIVAASLLVGATPWAGQLVSLIAGIFVPVLTMWLCLELLRGWPHLLPETVRGRRAQWTVASFAGCLTALAPQLWPWSVILMSDAPALAFAVLGAAALARYCRPKSASDRRHVGSLGWLALAAGALAASVLIRWESALVAIPCAACALVALARGPWRTSLIHGVAAAAIAVAILSPVLGAAAAHLFGAGARGAAFIGDLQVMHWSPAFMLRREWTDIDGFLRFRLPNGVYYATAPARWFFFTPLLAPFIAVGAAAAIRARAAIVWLFLIAWPVIVVGYVAGIPQQNARFALPILAPLAVLLAIGVAVTWGWLGRRQRVGLIALLLCGATWMAVGAVRLTQSFADRKADHLALVRWTEQQVPVHARLVTFSLTSTFEHYSGLRIFNLFDLAPPDLAALSSNREATYLLLDVAQVEAQWKNRSPYQNYLWLRDGPRLVPIGEREGWTLFRVGDRNASEQW